MEMLAATDSWLNNLIKILEHGKPVGPRGKPTLEMLHQFVHVDMRMPVITTAARKLGYKFMAAEAAWILSGDNRVETILPFAKQISDFSDDGEQFFGAYGPQIRDQLPHISRILRKDGDTRQAVLTIWRPSPPDTKDVPCTVSMQFLLRSGQIHLMVGMRSSDVWLGLPYDIFNFTMVAKYVQLLLAKLTKVEYPLGQLTIAIGSQHLYLENYEQARIVLRRHKPMNYPAHEETLVCPSVLPDDLVQWLWRRAHDGDILAHLRKNINADGESHANANRPVKRLGDLFTSG